VRFNVTEETKVFYRKSKNQTILKSFILPSNLIEKINKIKNNQEKVLFFSKGDKADFLYERSCVNELSFNYFQIYEENVYLALREISKMLFKICKKNEISITKNMYFIASEYEEDFSSKFWYDSGGIRIPIFCGYWFLDCEDEASVIIENQKINVKSGTILLFEAGQKIVFKNVNKAISFNLSTMSKIKNQYPQKWMPILL
jgi:hypothetical protein